MHEVVNKSFDLAMILSGQDKVYSFIPPHQGGSLDFAFHKKKEFGEKNERRPLVGTVRSENVLSTTEDRIPIITRPAGYHFCLFTKLQMMIDSKALFLILIVKSSIVVIKVN